MIFVFAHWGHQQACTQVAWMLVEWFYHLAKHTMIECTLLAACGNCASQLLCTERLSGSNIVDTLQQACPEGW
jgi:hypothetical protein